MRRCCRTIPSIRTSTWSQRSSRNVAGVWTLYGRAYETVLVQRTVQAVDNFCSSVN
eukprot:m.348939 g.348939  ORF g.348939 m.348939 type:complete len:56 (+) comp20683_c0_seq11:2181-2348(+)